MAIISKHTLTLHSVRVIDSDTIEAWVQVSSECRLLWRIRLKGVEGGELDTVEGQAGARVLSDLVDLHQSAGLHFRGLDTIKDKYGRHVGEVILSDGRSLNHILLTEHRYWPRDRTGREFPRPRPDSPAE